MSVAGWIFEPHQWNFTKLPFSWRSSNDITIQDSEVSALQGIILCRKDKFFITDEVSSNGTLLNGNDLEPRKP